MLSVVKKQHRVQQTVFFRRKYGKQNIAVPMAMTNPATSALRPRLGLTNPNGEPRGFDDDEDVEDDMKKM
jgi:hypothetical protein